MARAGGAGLCGSAWSAAALAATLAANVAVYRHDAHLDLTREEAFTPSREASDIVRSLTEPVQVVYFFQKENAAGRGAATMLDLLARLNPRLAVETVDIDRNPARASSFGVQLYNTAVIVTSSHRLQVVTTDDREIALGILRALRRQQPVVCFVTGHGEYDIDNFEFHTHFEGSHSHSHNTEGMALVQMEQHGLGRHAPGAREARAGAAKGPSCGPAARAAGLRRAGRRQSAHAANCRPRPTCCAPISAGGGSYMLLVEPDLRSRSALAAVIADAGAGSATA